MTLQRKTTYIVMLVFLCMIGILNQVFSKLLLQRFEAIEEREMNANVERVQRAIGFELDHLVAKSEDWAKWDDSYDFMKTRNKKYVSANLNFETLNGMGLEHLLYVEPNGRLFHGITIDHENEETMRTIPTGDEMSSLLSHESLVTHKTSGSFSKGLLFNGDQLLLVASHPILDSERKKPSRGTMIFTKAASPEFIKMIAEQTRLRVQAHPLPGGHAKDSSSEEIVRLLLSLDAPSIKPEDQEHVVGYGLLRDLDGNPALLVKVDAPRPVFNQGKATMQAVLAFLSVAGIVSILVLTGALHISVIARLSRLSTEVTEIGKTGDTSRRVAAKGKDEIAALSAQINTMLQRLDDTQAELVVARVAAEKANEAKSRFVAHVSHELRTPIHGITGMLNIVLDLEKAPAIREHLEMAKRSAQGLLAVINDILDFSKVESGKLSLDPIDFTVRPVVYEALRTVAPKAFEKGLEILCSIDPALPERFHGDSLRLKQVIINLMGNAIKFTKTGEVGLALTCGVLDPGQYQLRFEVHDTGIGIPAGRQAAVFEPFTQADGSIARKYQGTGLGLTISKQLVEMMGGNIGLTSEPGKGTTFFFTVPLPALEPRVSTRAPEGLRLLLAEPHDNLRASLRLDLVKYGVNITAGRDLEGVQGEFDLVAIDGKTFLDSPAGAWTRIRVPEGRTRALVTWLAPGQIKLRQELEQRGVTNILLKPLTASQILFGTGAESDETADIAPVEDPLQAGTFLPALHFLVADDSKTNQVILQNMLVKSGHKVTVVNDGKEMLDCLEEQAHYASQSSSGKFDLILTDIQMPEMDGMTAAQMIRDKEHSSERASSLHIPIVAVTAQPAPDELAKCFAAGIDAAVLKPISPKDLARTVKELLQRFGGRKLPDVPPPSPHPSTPAYFPGDSLVEASNKHLAAFASEIQALSGQMSPPLDRPPPFFDMQGLLDRFPGDPAFVREILAVFLDELKTFMEALERAIEKRDFDETRRAAHALKGAMVNSGAPFAAEIALRIERAAAANSFDIIPSSLESLRAMSLVLGRLISGIVETTQPQPGRAQAGMDVQEDSR